jgi:hypothetical protein
MKCEYRRHRFECCFNFLFNHRNFMRGFASQSDFFPMGVKSNQGRYMLNMGMALAARMRDCRARDSTFTCLNAGGSGQSSASLKKRYR